MVTSFHESLSRISEGKLELIFLRRGINKFDHSDDVFSTAEITNFIRGDVSHQHNSKFNLYWESRWGREGRTCEGAMMRP